MVKINQCHDTYDGDRKTVFESTMKYKNCAIEDVILVYRLKKSTHPIPKYQHFKIGIAIDRNAAFVTYLKVTK